MGKNIPGLTNFLIDHLPMYNKFRSVSSALVMAELTIPLLALLGLARICHEPEVLRKDNKYIYISLALTGGVCLLFALAPGLFFGNCLNYNEQEMLTKLGGIFPPDFINRYEEAIGSVRHAILTADAWRSLAFILVGFAILWLYRIDKIKAPAMCIMLTVVCLIDLWGVDRRYLNNDNFTTAQQNMAIVEKTPADEQILADKAPDYRVLDLTHDTFNDNTAGYWHKNIGGYHAAVAPLPGHRRPPPAARNQTYSRFRATLPTRAATPAQRAEHAEHEIRDCAGTERTEHGAAQPARLRCRMVCQPDQAGKGR